MRSVLLAGFFSLGFGAATFAQTGAAAFLLSQQPDPYVGNQMCARCHASYEDSLTGTPHEGFDAIAEHGCQTCHGPGRAHVQNPRDPERKPRIERIGVEQRREACLGCHDDTGHDREHFQAGQACSSCHTIHDFDAGVTGPAGDTQCVSCHEDAAAPAMLETPVGAFPKPGFHFWGTAHSTERCSSCHTLGSLEEQTWEARAGTDRCLSCHSQAHPRFFASSHARAGLSCKSCHSVHSGNLIDVAAADDYIGRASQQCTECHAAAVTEFTFNEHHRLEEGIMECTSCHDPHEPTPRVRLGGFKTQQCTQCHVDKLGPFVFEHGTSLVEGCTSCHSPHGSPNRFMLAFQAEGDLCYSCHVVMPGFHSRFTSETMCTSCHWSIHGSNLDPAFLN